MENKEIKVAIAGTYNSKVSAHVGNNIESKIIHKILLDNYIIIAILAKFSVLSIGKKDPFKL